MYSLTSDKTKNLQRITVLVIITWTTLTVSMYILDTTSLHETTLTLAMNEAKSNYQKDLSFRSWVTSHGGIYAPITDQNPPNPYLNNITDQNVTTPSGINLTLINPAYAQRQLYEEYSKLENIIGHLTSLNPIRPANGADEWETTALTRFEQGETEVLELTTIYGESYLRLMRPIITQEGCLKCHAQQGYIVGDIRGGLSISVPMKPYLSQEAQQRSVHMLGYGTLWILGCALVFIGSRRLNHQMLELALQERLEEQVIQLQKRDEMKNSFIAKAAHELRTPVTAIHGFIEVILRSQDGTIDPITIKMLNTVSRNAERLSRLTDNLLDSQTAISGEMKINPEAAHVSMILREILEEMMPVFESKELSLVSEIADALPMVMVDSERISQVLRNLLDNAVKFTQNGGAITVSASHVGNDVLVSVSDTGLGIIEEDIGGLFEAFPKIDRTWGYPGAGLGLAISKNIVELHGGEIWVESEGPGKGSKFSFMVPVVEEES